MMGQLFASQVHAAICRDVSRAPTQEGQLRRQEGGRRFHEEEGLRPGRTLSWNELTKHATGEDLNPKAFAAEFQEK